MSRRTRSFFFNGESAKMVADTTGDAANTTTSGFDVADFADAALIDSGESFSDVDTVLLTAAAIDDRIVARAPDAISVTDAGGDGSLAYSSGEITYTGPSATEVRAHFSGGTGVTITDGAVAIGQAVATNSDVQFNDLQVDGDAVVTGNLTVNGTTTTIATTNQVVSDTLIELGNGTTGSPANDAGIVIERGDSDNAFMGWDESSDKFLLGTGSFTGASTGNLAITAGTLVADLEGNVTGNLTGNVTGTVSSLSNQDTDALGEGSTNQYHTVERVQDAVGDQFVTNGSHTGISFSYDDAGDGAIDATVSLSGFSTSDLSEGTNQYFTQARARTAISVTDNGGDGSLSYDEATGAISYQGPVAADVQAHFSAGTGIGLSSGTISLSHLGLESLTDPNADRIFMWDDSAGASAFMDLGAGLTITGTTIKGTAIYNASGTLLN
jgi:hypothetical protein